mmetsp:Transcript_33032/g.80287  ORF Transcript_33032/g.80287 Transcript_33032/m.80287 type:complete len:235 (+) Transcript_33032:620-1324(+)
MGSQFSFLHQDKTQNTLPSHIHHSISPSTKQPRNTFHPTVVPTIASSSSSSQYKMIQVFLILIVLVLLFESGTAFRGMPIRSFRDNSAVSFTNDKKKSKSKSKSNSKPRSQDDTEEPPISNPSRRTLNEFDACGQSAKGSSYSNQCIQDFMEYVPSSIHSRSRSRTSWMSGSSGIRESSALRPNDDEDDDNDDGYPLWKRLEDIERLKNSTRRPKTVEEVEQILSQDSSIVEID